MTEPGKGELVEAMLMPDVFSANQVQRLKELETVIRSDLQAFLRVGAALAEIRNNGLYMVNSHVSFERYLRDKWGMGQSQGYRLIDAHTVVQSLKSSPIGELLPDNESQIRPLTKYKDKPEMLANVWQMAVNAAHNGKITAKLVKNALTYVTGEEVDRKIRKASAVAEKAPHGISEFTTTYQLLLDAISREVASGFATTDKETILMCLEAALGVVDEI
ncbi:MAG: hypothetical protein KJ990_12680 [Proteobacteria bacterium]|nr:hypothetical protein [Pseudomonadota bacterium]MBU1648207.1 hypothetical protein [Pseudomonadota bacterium]